MLSIVIIGKNEARNLKKLFDSIEKIVIKKEIIYVDSSSDDNSVEIANLFCTQVIEIESSPNLCASAGRYVGTKYANYSWVLYLDGDMQLEVDFIKFINEEIFLTYPDRIVGFIGYYTYYYDDNTVSKNRLMQAPNEIVNHFGGAVMLQKEIVLKANNWNPSVVSNEEFDLYIRINYFNVDIFGLDMNMVKHKAKKISNFNSFIEMFYPKNKRFFGFGQSLVSQYKNRTLLKFISKKPYPFLFLFLLLLSPFIKNMYIFVFILIAYISITKKWHYNFIYISDIIRGIVGIFKYKNYKPKIKK